MAAAAEIGEIVLDERKMYTVEWLDGSVFGFTVTPVKSDRGSVLLLARRTTDRAKLELAGLEDVVPGDMLVAIGDEKVYHLGAENAAKYLRSVQKPVRLTLQLSPYGCSAKTLPDLAPNEYNYKWESGPLGIVLTPDPKSKIPIVKRITATPDRAHFLRDVSIGDELIYANDIPTREYSMSAIINIIKELPKPIILRFRRPLDDDHLVAEVPELGADEYDFLWEYGPLGLVVGTSKEGLPFVRSFTGKGTSRQLALVQENDEIVMVNDRSAKQMGFTETMTYIMNVPKPAVIRFRKNKAARDSLNTGMADLTIKANKERESNGGNGTARKSENQNNNYNNVPRQSRSASQPHDGPPLDLAFPAPTVNNQSEDFFEIDHNAFYKIRWTDGPFGFTVREATSKTGTVILVTKRTGKSTCAGLKRVAVGDILIKIGDTDIWDLGFERGTTYLRTVPKPVSLTFQAID